MRIKISGGTVVTVNEDMQIWDPGHVIVVDGEIADVGPGPGPDGVFDEVIAADNHIVMPGLVNAHAHSPSNILKGTWSGLPLEIWRQFIRAGWRAYEGEAILVSAQLGLLEMIKTGCTSVLDHFYSGARSRHMGALNAVDAMVGAGMRGALALTVSDEPYQQTVGLEEHGLSEDARREVERISRFESSETLDEFAVFADEVENREGLVVPMIGPSAPHRCTSEMLRSSMALAVERGIAMHMHVAETKGQFLRGRELFGSTPIAHLDRLGLLGDRMSMAHCVWLTDEDLELVSERGATVIHNPASNGKLGSGRMRLKEMIAAGVRVGLATDGSGSNDNQNMFEAMRLAALIHNGPESDYLQWPTPERILRMATVDGAHAMGMGGKVGSLQRGWAADVVILTKDSVHFSPTNDVVNQLVFCENGTSVTDVMIGGNWVVRDRVTLTIDEAALYADARRLRAEMDADVREQLANTEALVPALREIHLRNIEVEWEGREAETGKRGT